MVQPMGYSRSPGGYGSIGHYDMSTTRSLELQAQGGAYGGGQGVDSSKTSQIRARSDPEAHEDLRAVTKDLKAMGLAAGGKLSK
jgi:hypothetical protein